jgi:F1F0 ATPase subunit 2
MSTSLLVFAAALVGGMALGVLHFGGLWWTLRRLPGAQHPAILMVGSVLARSLVTVAGLYFIMGGAWQRLIVALGGFLVTRLMLTYWLRPKPVPDTHPREK